MVNDLHDGGEFAGVWTLLDTDDTADLDKATIREKKSFVSPHPSLPKK